MVFSKNYIKILEQLYVKKAAAKSIGAASKIILNIS